MKIYENEAEQFTLSKIARLFFHLLIFSIALMQPYFSFANQRLSLTDFLFSIVTFFWFIKLIKKQSTFRWHKFYYFLGFYFASMLISAIFSINPQQSFIKLSGELYLIGLCVLTFNFIQTEKDFRDLIKIWIYGTFVTIIVGLISFLIFYIDRQNLFLNYTTYHYGSVPIGNYPRISSTFISASMFCNYLNVSLLMIFIAEHLKILSKKKALIFSVATAFLAIMTISSGLSGVFLSFGMMTWYSLRLRFKLTAWLALVSGIFVMFSFLTLNFIALQPHSTSPYSISIPFISRTFSPSPRLLIWSESAKTFFDNFWTGKGIGQDACRVIFQNTEGTTSILTDAHNIFLSVAAQNGFLGLIAILLITLYLLKISFPFKKSFTNSAVILNSLAIAFLSAFVIQGLSGAFEDTRHLWILMGLLVSANSLFKNDLSLETQ